VIAAQVGFAGSTKLEDYVVAGGQAGFAGHLKIGRGARIAAKSGVMKDIPPGETYGGFPAVPIRQWHRQNVTAAQLADGKRKGK
jgi:UDP-3-O-[3-hydroxymyristoyl] glucosamine N-acyltransferase